MLGIPEEYSTVVLSYGGSLGSKAINDAVVNAMCRYTADREGLIHYHALGRVNGEEAKKKMSELGLYNKKNLVISDYIYNMPLYMSAADIIISRAGAMTISELSAVRSAAIIIPSPNVTDNHQYKNAKILADAEGAILLEEAKLCEDTLACEIERLVSDKALRDKMSENISAFSNSDAGKRIYNEIVELVRSKKKSK